MVSVAKTLRMRAFIFTCSYKTAWTQWMTAEEKRGYSFADVNAIITRSK